MTPLEGLTIGSANSVADPKIKTNFETLSGLLGGSNKIKGAGIESATVEDAQLGSPNNSAYRLIDSVQSTFGSDKAAGTYILTPNTVYVSGSGTFVDTINPPPVFYFAKADYEVSGKTQKLRLRAQIGVNATKAAIKFTFGLYPITVAGAADVLVITLGTVVSGSTVEINEPAASTVSQANSGDFTIPADGAYVLGVVSGATLTNNSMTILATQLQTRSV